MLALVGLTQPGPFRPRTHQMGRYVGVRHEGQLVAMAGERLELDDYIEVSAVCTHPDFRRRGLGAALTLDVAAHIAAQGKTPMLHAAATNTGAIRVYERLGFTIRRTVTALVMRAPSREEAPRAR